jgi:hypothetical protein
MRHRHELNIELPVDTCRGFEIVVQRDHRVAEAPAKVVYYSNHAQWYPSDPKARENVEEVFIRRFGSSADRF